MSLKEPMKDRMEYIYFALRINELSEVIEGVHERQKNTHLFTFANK